MTRKLIDGLNTLPPQRLAKVKARAAELATLKEMRVAAKLTQEKLAVRSPNRPSVKLVHLADVKR